MYEYAVETMRQFLALAEPALATHLRIAIARMVVAVAQASGEGWFGSGDPVSDEERASIGYVARLLDLHDCPQADEILRTL